MKEGLRAVLIASLLFIGIGLLTGTPMANAARSESAKTAAKSKVALHQFTGVVTAVDKSSLTVEKQGKAPRTMQFVKHAEMTSTGEIEKAARVTVYYRDEDGHPTAHRVVVRAATERKR